MGFLQVGPMYYPPQPNAAQVIQRGPHGWRFGTGPQRQPDGTYRWWNDQSVTSGDYKGMWQPTQSIVGVMGLGGLADVASALTPKPQDMAAGFLLGPLGFVASKLMPETSQSMWDTATGNATAGPKVFDATRNPTTGSAPPQIKANLTQLVRSLESEASKGRYSNAQFGSMLEQARASVMSAGRWTDSGVAPSGQAYISQPELLAAISKLKNMQIVSSGQVREDGRPMIAPGVVGPDGSRARMDDANKAFRDELLRQINSPTGSVQTGLSTMAKTALAVGAGAVLIFGLGSGLARRR